MVGPLNTPDVPSPEGEVLPPAEGAKTGIAGLLSTTVGKLVLGGVVFLVIVGILAAIAVVFFLSGDPDGDVVVVPATGSKPASGTAEIPPARRSDPLPQDVFAFRNIFQPTSKPSVPVTSTTSAEASGSIDGVRVPDDTLYLQSVSVQDGVDVATFIWNGSSYTASEGATLGDTPWKVLSISGNTVEMLYGDSRVTLVVGQGLVK